MNAIPEDFRMRDQLLIEVILKTRLIEGQGGRATRGSAASFTGLFTLRESPRFHVLIDSEVFLRLYQTDGNGARRLPRLVFRLLRYEPSPLAPFLQNKNVEYCEILK